MATLYQTAPIEIEFQTFIFPVPDVEYEALSYAWGDQSVKHGVDVDGCLLQVSQNLHDALCYLRRTEGSRILWVDALCINQADDKEKNHQVRQMRDIYSTASQVVIWLGESDDDIEEAMEFLRDSKENRDQRAKPIPGLLKLYANPWWRRVWVIQEVAVASSDPLIMCGSSVAPWKAATWAFFQMYWEEQDLNSSPAFSSVHPSTFSSLRTDGGPRFRSATDLEAVLRITSNRQASVPHDYIYAVLGIFPNSERTELFKIDYAEEPRIPFQRAMVKVMTNRQDLHWLTYARACRGGDLSGALPSWCIDFSSTTWVSDIEDKQWEIQALRAAEFGSSKGREMPPIVHDPASGTLVVRGIRIGTIGPIHASTTGELQAVYKTDYPTWSDKEKRALVNRSIERLHKDIGRFSSLAYPALSSRIGHAEAAARMARGDAWKIIAYGDKDTLPKGKLRQSPSWWGEIFAVLEKISQDFYLSSQESPPEWAELLISENPRDPNFSQIVIGVFFQLAYSTGGCCYFATDSGHIGMAGHEVQSGDVLSILFGSKYPAVLRPRPDGKWTLVTFAYTLDVMAGELLTNEASIVEESFVLI